MTITKLKAKNQLTIPAEIAKRMNLRPDELFSVEIENDYIKLIPVELEPRYSPEELGAIDHIVEREKSRGTVLKPGKEFSAYIKKITR